MSGKIFKTITNFTKNYNDPESNLPFDENNTKIQIVEKNGNVNVSLTINDKYLEQYNKIAELFKEGLSKLEGVLSVNVALTSENQLSSGQQNESRFKINATNIIAIASGKGGVGKSTFAVNLAVALRKLGKKVGILDADIYGPSVPRMMGISGRPEASNNKKLIPLESYGIKCMSIGFLVSVDTPTIWRGPMVMKALEQMFNGVEWGTLDYLIIDLPPGTGDAQLTLAQSSKLSGSIIVSTPQDVALADARKGINMFKRVNVPILGLVENMSYFICDNCNEKHFIFSNDGAKKEAEKFQIPFLGSLPISKDLRVQSDEGRPSCIDDPNGEIYKFNALTIWGVIDLLASFTLLIDGKFSISLNFPKLLENMYLVIADKNAENREVSSDYWFEYIEANLHLIGGLHNLDNFASSVSPKIKDEIHEFRFCKKGIKNIKDISIPLTVWKRFIASSTY